MYQAIDDDNYDLAIEIAKNNNYIISQDEFDYSVDKMSDITEFFVDSCTGFDNDSLEKNLDSQFDDRALHLFHCCSNKDENIIDKAALKDCWKFVKSTLEDGYYCTEITLECAIKAGREDIIHAYVENGNGNINTNHINQAISMKVHKPILSNIHLYPNQIDYSDILIHAINNDVLEDFIPILPNGFIDTYIKSENIFMITILKDEECLFSEDSLVYAIQTKNEDIIRMVAVHVTEDDLIFSEGIELSDNIRLFLYRRHHRIV